MLQHADQRPENVTRECCTAKHPFLVQQVLNSLQKDFSTGSCDSDLPTRVILLCVTKIINWILLPIAYSAARRKSPMEPLDVLSVPNSLTAQDDTDSRCGYGELYVAERSDE